MDFSQTEQDFVVEFNSGSGGSGQDGFSPIVDIVPIDGGHRITITDIQGTKSFDVMNGKDGKDGVDGKDGYTPQKGVDYWTEEDVEAINKYIDDKFNAEIIEALEGYY